MVVDIFFAGILCCIAMDLWQRLLFVLYKIPPTNWAPTGRWLLMLINKGIIFNINLENENNTLLVIKLFRNEKKVLIPFVKEIVSFIDIKNNFLIINPPKGLLDL